MSYPTLADVHEDLAYLFEILTGKTAPSLDKALFHGWELQGYLQSVVIPVQTAGTMSAKSSIDFSKFSSITLDQILDALEGLLHLSKDAASAAASPPVTRLKATGLLDTLGPALLKQLSTILLPALMGWLQDWLVDGKLMELINSLFKSKSAAPAPA